MQFSRQARGSLYELIDQVLVAEECEYIDHQVSQTIIDEIKIAIVVLNGYIRYLKARKESD